MTVPSFSTTSFQKMFYGLMSHEWLSITVIIFKQINFTVQFSCDHFISSRSQCSNQSIPCKKKKLLKGWWEGNLLKYLGIFLKTWLIHLILCRPHFCEQCQLMGVIWTTLDMLSQQINTPNGSWWLLCWVNVINHKARQARMPANMWQSVWQLKN